MKEIRLLRQIGWIEATSFLLLLLIAMPLKYIWGMPLAVRIIGMAHGILFMIFIAYLFKVARAQQFSNGLTAKCLAGSVLPLGPLLYEKDLQTMLGRR